jgi:hypothetical protein
MTSMSTHSPGTEPPAATLARLERDGATPEQAMAFFDSLPAMSVEELLGAWKGSEIRTGYPLEGLLQAFGWHGKRFDSPEAVHPLVMGRPGALFTLDPVWMPIGFVREHHALFRSAAVGALARGVMGLFSTREPRAQLRLTEFRGVTTATMVYDALPINDVFRKVDGDTALGVMDVRGDVAPEMYFFALRRER